MFGPVFTLYKARDKKHAIELANQGEYGLGGEVFSKDHGE
jgi:acyl-CoA reductase-like NAD-dependent aldehyde dehydrogenase